jgi:hypothetical protein
MSSKLSRQFSSGPVKAAVGWWIPRVREVLGDALIGVSLTGGVELGEFEPGWSDVDFCAQLTGPVTDSQAAGLGRLHDRLEARLLSDRHGTWRSLQALEGAYLPAALANRPGEQSRSLLVGTGTRSVEVCDPVPGFERYVLAHHSVTVTGASRPFRPPTHEAMASAQAWLPGRLSRPATEHSSIMLAGLLQEIARTIVFFRDGKMVGKSAALESEIRSGDEFRDPYRLALDVRRAGSRTADERRPELVRAYERVASPARLLLRPRIESARETKSDGLTSTRSPP